MTETKVRSLKAVQKKAKEFLDKVPYICVSSVEGGTLLVGREGNYFGKIPSVKVISTVGAGDSMVAGMISQLQSGGVIPSEMLRWGLAAAAATLSEPGTTLGSASRIRQLYEKAVVRKI
jgi:fructose-1-phosphate kinase PfkB-like protein